MQRSCYQKYVYGLFAFLNIWLLAALMFTNLLFSLLSFLPILESFSHFGWVDNIASESMDLGVRQL